VRSVPMHDFTMTIRTAAMHVFSSSY
jgi:hypothetical protein